MLLMIAYTIMLLIVLFNMLVCVWTLRCACLKQLRTQSCCSSCSSTCWYVCERCDVHAWHSVGVGVMIKSKVDLWWYAFHAATLGSLNMLVSWLHNIFHCTSPSFANHTGCNRLALSDAPIVFLHHRLPSWTTHSIASGMLAGDRLMNVSGGLTWHKT